jgi:hypothetical protein
MRITNDIHAGIADRGAISARVRRAPVWLQVDPAPVPVTGGVAP